MATKAQIKQWKDELMRDFSNCDPYFINLVCELYEKNPEYIKKASKKKYKPIEHKTPNEIVGAVQVLNNPDEETINKYFKPSLVVKDEDAEQAKQ